MIKNVCKNLFNLLFLATASLMTVQQYCVHERCEMRFIYDDKLNMWHLFAELERNPLLPPHDDDEEQEMEPLNDAKEAEFNERPGKRRRQKNNDHTNFS